MSSNCKIIGKSTVEKILWIWYKTSWIVQIWKANIMHESQHMVWIRQKTWKERGDCFSLFCPRAPQSLYLCLLIHFTLWHISSKALVSNLDGHFIHKSVFITFISLSSSTITFILYRTALQRDSTNYMLHIVKHPLSGSLNVSSDIS